MQVIIPLAGKGTRLRPHTHLVLKPMLKVAGRPVMDWVMDRLAGLEVTELIFITGHLRDQVEAYSSGRYGIPCRYMHTGVETLDPRDVERCARLLAHYLASLPLDWSVVERIK